MNMMSELRIILHVEDIIRGQFFGSKYQDSVNLCRFVLGIIAGVTWRRR